MSAKAKTTIKTLINLPTTDAPPCTPEQHAASSKAKPLRLLGLSDGPHGKAALLKFPGDWVRAIGLPTEADAWHPMFDELPCDDAADLRAHALPGVVLHPDGTRTRQGPLSFITEEVNRVGGWTVRHCFDVPAQRYAAGHATGLRCAAELLTALQRGYGPRIDLTAIIQDAAMASTEHRKGASRQAAASAFLSVVAAALPIMASQSHHAPWLEAKITEAERWQTHQAKKDAESKAAFVERMKAARAAKRSKPHHADA